MVIYQRVVVSMMLDCELEIRLPQGELTSYFPMVRPNIENMYEWLRWTIIIKDNWKSWS